MLIADTKKSVLRTIAEMDLDKINMDLVENLLEWIVDGPHGYPPGTDPAEPRSRGFVVDRRANVCLSPARRHSGVSAGPG